MQISVVFTSDNFKAEDTVVEIYDKYKISILISDGINAVTKDSVIGGKSGNIVFFRPDELHFGRFFNSGAYRYLDIFIPINFFENFINANTIINFLTDKSSNRKNCIYFEPEQQKSINKNVSQILEYIKCENKTNDIKIFSCILQIIALCNDYYELEKKKI